MAAVTEAVFTTNDNGGNSSMASKLFLVAGIAAVAAVMFAAWMWSQQPDYRVLFANYQDKDGGAIVGALEQMNIPYKFAEGGGAILVPAAQVHQARLKLASQGLPKGGNIGFELLESQKFGVSQFVEQVNFQRALEGELERTIQSIGAVEGARIHLAIPKSSVFVRDQQKPTASVMLNMRPGRILEPQQVSAVLHLVASSVPELAVANVTVVDQNGNLLSDASKKQDGSKLDPSQIKYVDDLQQNVAKRVESIIAPIVGAKNVHAEANAEIDFSSIEQANETYKPNQKPEDITIRSQQTSENSSAASGAASGVPGALSNQPPPTASAPVNSPAGAAANTATATNATPTNSQKNSTTNFEVDKTVRYLQQSMGGVKRLSVAVVVNFKQVTDKKGKSTNQPLTDAEKKQLSDLAKQAMGFNEPRGDTLTIVNSAFVVPEAEIIPAIPMWKNPELIETAKLVLRYLLGIVVVLMLYKKLLKPMSSKLITSVSNSPLLTNAQGERLIGGNINGMNGQAGQGGQGAQNGQIGADGQSLLAGGGTGQAGANVNSLRNYQGNLQSVKEMAKENPKMVANIVTEWVAAGD